MSVSAPSFFPSKHETHAPAKQSPLAQSASTPHVLPSRHARPSTRQVPPPSTSVSPGSFVPLLQGSLGQTPSDSRTGSGRMGRSEPSPRSPLSAYPQHHAEP